MTELKSLFENLYNLTFIEDIAYHEFKDGRLCPIYKRGSNELSQERWKEIHGQNPVNIDGDPVLEKSRVGKVVHINYVKDNPESSGAFGLFGIDSILVVPKLNKEEIAEGIFVLASIGKIHEFSEEEIRLVTETIDKYIK